MSSWSVLSSTTLTTSQQKTSRTSCRLSTIQDSENRICRLLFKMAVEMDMMMNVLAAGMEIPEEDLERLRGRCVREVKATSGGIDLKHAVRFQRGIPDERFDR